MAFEFFDNKMHFFLVADRPFVPAQDQTFRFLMLDAFTVILQVDKQRRTCINASWIQKFSQAICNSNPQNVSWTEGNIGILIHSIIY